MESTPVGARIVERIADREGVDPLDLDVLHDVIDGDALDAITNRGAGREAGESVRVEFTYHGYEVTVDGNEEITIDEHSSLTASEDASRGEAVDD